MTQSRSILTDADRQEDAFVPVDDRDSLLIHFAEAVLKLGP